MRERSSERRATRQSWVMRWRVWRSCRVGGWWVDIVVDRWIVDVGGGVGFGVGFGDGVDGED